MNETDQGSMITSLEVVEYRLRLGRSLSPGEATQLRGYFGRTFAGELLLHHHHADGSLYYAYPRVQFKVLDRSAHLLGFAEGGDLVTRLWSAVDCMCIGGEDLPILEAGLTRRGVPLGEVAEPVVYRLRTPWLGLNQENFHAYDTDKDSQHRRALLERVLVGNCLALAKAFGHRVRTQLVADASRLRPHTARLKGVTMLAFVGTFRVNFMIPDRAGIGKSVSRGFGTVERVGAKEQSPC